MVLTNFPSAISPVPQAAYIHIPFCRRRCYYCDFPVTVVGDRARGTASGTIEQYLAWLCEEILATPSHSEQPLQTVFFGGGTPSLLDPEQVQRLLQCLDRHFGIDPKAEISMEMDPGTFTKEHLNGYLAAGVNRVSLGAQAFQDQLLRACGRTHSVADIYEAVELLRQRGCQNFSLDLISGLPQQTLEQWDDSLTQAIALAPNHLSAYDLVVEPGTVFGKRYVPGDQPLPSDDLTAQMYRRAAQRLQEAGYEHYEISNYAQKGFRCRHNQVYWRNEAYYGFGMGSASFLNQYRFSRPRSRVAYREWLDEYIASRGEIAAEPVSESDRLFETLMLGFRQSDGIDLGNLRTQFGEFVVAHLIKILTPFCAQGWVEWLTPDWLRFSDPEGFLFSNQILVTLWEGIESAAILTEAQ
jgi:putative oxygen-independent coproporphyrinogen III oxidase